MFFHMAEYCDTIHTKEKRNREYKACLNERAILHLLDHDVTWKSGCFLAHENGAIWGWFVRGLVRSDWLVGLVLIICQSPIFKQLTEDWLQSK